MLTDSHAHLSSKEVRPIIHELLNRAQQAHVHSIINIATCPDELEFGLELSNQYPWIFNAGSTTPHDALEFGDAHFSYFEKAAKEKKLVAIGETGLDYHYYADTKESQKELLIRYLNLALEVKRPIIIHCREAFDDLFKVLDEHYKTSGNAYGKGVLHCFTGSLDEAAEVIKRGFYLSLSGIVTYKKSFDLRDAAKRVPLDHLLIETDTPYLAPLTKRGKQNEPSYLIETASVVADAQGISLEELAAATSENARRLFNLS